MNLEQAIAHVKQAMKPQLEVMNYDPELSALRGKRGSGTTRAAIMEMGLLAQANANTRYVDLVRAALLKPNGKLIVTESVD